MLVEKYYGSGELVIVDEEVAKDLEVIKNYLLPQDNIDRRTREARVRRKRIERTRRWINRRLSLSRSRGGLAKYFHTLYEDEPNRFNKNRKYMRKSTTPCRKER